MTQEILNIVFSGIGVIITGLATWATSMLVKWLNTKIKDKELLRWATELTNIVMSSVAQVTQTYVDSLKKKGAFTKEAQQEALNKCLHIIKSQLSAELIKYIEDNFGDIEEYLITQIESTIKMLK